MNYVGFDQAVRINKAVLSSPRIGLLNSGNLRFCLDRTTSVSEQGDTETILAPRGGNLIFCIVRNHPFLDGNKRTAYQMAYVFLLSNGYALHEVDSRKAVSLLAGVADGRVLVGEVISWVGEHLRPSR